MEWDFATNQEIDEDTFGKAPEGFRTAYAKGEDGKYRVADTHRPFVDAISGLTGALKNERNSSKALKGQKDIGAALKESLGFETLDEAKAKFEELNTLVTTASKVDPAKIRADIQRVSDQAIAAKDGEIATMSKTLSRYMVDNAAVTAIATAKGNSKLLMPLVRDQVELVKDGEDYVVRVKDGAGDYRGNGKGGFMSVEELIAEMRASKDYAGAFESDNLGGTGPTNRPGQQQQRGMERQQNREDQSSTDRIAAGLAARRRNRS